MARETDSSGLLQSPRAVSSESGTADQAISELLCRSGSSYKSSAISLSGASVNAKTWLGYGHPSFDCLGVQRRIVSHPDPVTCESKTLSANSGRLRVVSLPETISLGGCISGLTHQNQEFEGHSPHNREYPPDLPQTPSPPSSPDSVVIIGNEAHVPSSFFQSGVDANGNT